MSKLWRKYRFYSGNIDVRFSTSADLRYKCYYANNDATADDAAADDDESTNAEANGGNEKVQQK